MKSLSPWLLCIAPMLDWTDRHFRYLLRLCAPHARLYTEMVTTGALLFGNVERHLAYSVEEHPLALQLGGSDPAALAKCATLAQHYDYDEINLNVGCPSSRVQSGQFGACLMKQPLQVAACIRAMREVCDIPVTVKTRIGVDEFDSYAFVRDFIGELFFAGCETFIMHARKAWLSGLSPKENRDIPPLSYPTVYQLKKDFPQCTFVINGGITSLEQSYDHLQQGMDGVMIGRVAYQDSYRIALIAAGLFSEEASSYDEILQKYRRYITEQLALGVPLHALTRHLLNLFNGQPNAKTFRRQISQHAYKKGAGISVLDDALAIFMNEIAIG